MTDLHVQVQCRFTSTETLRTIGTGEPRTATSVLTQLLSSVTSVMRSHSFMFFFCFLTTYFFLFIHISAVCELPDTLTAALPHQGYTLQLIYHWSSQGFPVLMTHHSLWFNTMLGQFWWPTIHYDSIQCQDSYDDPPFTVIKSNVRTVLMTHHSLWFNTMSGQFWWPTIHYDSIQC